MVELGMLRSPRLRAALFALERRLLEAADHVIVVTESFRRRVIEKGVRPDRVDVIPNGVDLTLYYASDDPPPVPALRKHHGEFLVGYLGTFGRGQGLESVVRAADRVASRRQGVRFVLAGDGPELPRIQAEIAKLHVSNVDIHPPIARRDTRAFYNSCDLCLVPLAPIPIFSETIPSKIFEVMACERPLVASVSGEGAAIIEQSGGGVRVEPGDSQALAEAILQVLDLSAEQRLAMGRSARNYVAARYDRANLADRDLEILEMVAGRKQTSGMSVERR
jgi:glycosyltransferase involved in cell wall biosynthesis